MLIDRRKFSIRTSVFFTSDEYTSDPTIGQNGTCINQETITLHIIYKIGYKVIEINTLAFWKNPGTNLAPKLLTYPKG